MSTRFFAPLSPDRLPDFTADLAEINGPFVSYLKDRYHAQFTIGKDQWRLRQLARWLGARGRNLRSVDRQQVSDLVRRFMPGCVKKTAACYTQTLGRWLKYKGRFTPPAGLPPWQGWLDDYREFQIGHKGLLPITADGNIRDVRTFLKWQFGVRPAQWPAVSVRDIWRYCRHCARNGKPIHANGQLFATRRFLQFVQMRGACGAQLADAVQHVANFGQPTHHKPALSDRDRKRFIASFNRASQSGSRDLAMALLMVDMGLRSCEVARLQFSDLDFTGRRLKLPPLKSSRERELPIPCHVAAALHRYIDRFRAATRAETVFVRYHHLIGRPLTSLAVGVAMSRAYRRCGFPKTISGSHLLRHTFATRMFARGVTIKGVADLLGHRQLHSANLYTHVAPSALHGLALPWPA
jgi:site-specific recombinase XerD